MEFSARAMHQLIKGQGDKRVSEPASVEFGKLLKQFAGDVAEEAIVLSDREGHHTFTGEDVRKALEK